MPADPTVAGPRPAEHVLGQIVPLRERLEGVLDELTDEQVSAASALPGWTRGHVLAHLAGVGSAVARQAEYVRAGRSIEFYDGGRVGRNADIEARADRSAAVHVLEVRTAALRVEAALAAQTEAGWRRPTANRGRTVAQLAETWWRELGIHLTDLDLGVGHEAWTPELLDHLAGYLAGRVPSRTRLVLVPGDGRWELGDPSARPVTVRGAATDLVAWLAGRVPAGPVVADADGKPVPLPVLLDLWP